MNIDMVRKDFEKWLLIPATKEEAEIYADDPELLPFVAGYRAALSTIDPDAIRRDDTCTWTEEESDDDCERHFESSCGLGFHIDDGRSLAENRILFCAKCGKKISEARP